MLGFIKNSLVMALCLGSGAAFSVSEVHSAPLSDFAARSGVSESELQFVTNGEIVKASKTQNSAQADMMGIGAQDFVENMAQRGLDFLADSDTSLINKRKQFTRLLQDSFDMRTIGRFSLGRYWRVSTPEQRKEYMSLFEKMVLEIYSSRFEEYKGEKLEVRGYRVESEKDTIVSSSIVPVKGPEVQIDWRVRYKNGSYKIVDIVVEGVSMSVTQRSDFSSVIQRGGGSVDALLVHLRGQQEDL